jgi:hypothetical protein
VTVTNVRIVADGPTGKSTKIINDETGEQIMGIARVDVAITPNQANSASIELFCVQADLRARGMFMLQHPRTGALKTLRRIEFNDGDVWEA